MGEGKRGTESASKRIGRESRNIRIERDVESGKEKGAQEGTMERLRDRKKDGMERERKEKRM